VGTVTPIRIGHDAALRLLREIATNDSHISVLASLEVGTLRLFLDRRKINRCLRLGSLVKAPIVDKHGNTVLVLERFAAGETISVEAIIEGVGHEKRILVTDYYRRKE
jgi:hypothetical protein